MRRIIIYLSAVASLLAVVIVVSCGGDDSVKLIFNQGQDGCATTAQSVATIQCDDGSIIFEGSVITSNPCYYLKAQLDVANQSNVEIVITATSQLGEDDSCVECVGGISFDGTVELSNACSRSLSIVYNGDVIAEYER